MTEDKTSTNPSRPAQTRAERQVAEYLRQHPDFFQRQPQLLMLMKLPHKVDGAASLLEHQATVLRERNQQLRRQLQELMAVAGENQARITRLHQLTVDILSAEDNEAAFQALVTGLTQHSGADRVLLVDFSETGAAPGAREIPPEQCTAFDDFRKRGEVLCGRLAPDQLRAIFRDEFEHIRSTALVPVDPPQPLVNLALAVGSHQADHFHPGQGTVFLELLGETVAARFGEAGQASRRRA